MPSIKDKKLELDAFDKKYPGIKSLFDEAGMSIMILSEMEPAAQEAVREWDGFAEENKAYYIKREKVWSFQLV